MKKKLIWLLLCATSFLFMYFIGGLMGCTILVMIGIHEMGHLMMAKVLGYPTSGFIFIPGLGGVAQTGYIPNLWHRFWVVYAGPAVGLMQILLVMVVNNYFFNLQFVWKMGCIWAVVNLFNMLPMVPLDGGQIFWCVGNSISKKYSQFFLFLPFQLFAFLLIMFIAGPIFASLIMFFGYFMIQQERALVQEDVSMNWIQILFAIGWTTLLILLLCWSAIVCYLSAAMIPLPL